MRTDTKPLFYFMTKPDEYYLEKNKSLWKTLQIRIDSYLASKIEKFF